MRSWEFAVRRWQFTLLVFGLLVAVGLSSWHNIARSDDPVFPIPVASIVAVYPGADPADVERLIVDPIEDAINTLDDVLNINSDSRNGLAVIMVEFAWDQDAEKKYDEVVREINALRPDLPPGLVKLDVDKFSTGLVNVVQLALVSERAGYRELESVATDLEDAIERVPGVRKAGTAAYAKPEVRVAVDLDRLSRLGVSVDDVANAIRAGNANLPGGAVEAGARRYNLKATGSYDSLDEIATTVVGAQGGRVVRVADVADVGWATAEATYTGRFNGERAVFVTANAKDGANVFDVRDGIYAVLDDFESRLPPGIALERGFDQSENVAHRLNQLGHDFMIAIALVLVTLLPLGLRASVIVMISIPLSLAIGLSALHFTGFSLNQLSIAGFVLALGLLVDDSIVVVENISRYLRMGYDRAQAAIAATDQIALAVVGCTATLLFAFLPLLFLPGGPGRYIRSLPASVLYTIFASLFVALTVIPFLASRLLARGGEANEGNAVLRAVKRGIERVYGPALRKALAWPKTTLLAGLAVFVLAVGTVPVIGFSLFPEAGIPQFLIDIDAPEGASLGETDRALRFVEDELAKRGDVRYWFSNLGHGNPRVYYNVFETETRANFAQVYAELDSRDPEDGPRVLDELRAAFRDYPAARISVKAFENGPPIAAPIAIRVSGPEIAQLDELAAKVEGLIRATPGTRDVDNPVRLSRTDLDLAIDTDKAALFGVSPGMADRTVRLAIAGYPVTRFREADGDEYDVTLRLPMAGGQQTLAALDEIQLGTMTGAKLPLRQLARPEFRTAPALIQRHNRERQVTVTAYTRTGYNTDRVTRAIAKQLRAEDWPAGYTFQVAGEAEARAESFGGLGSAILVAAFGMLAVLVLEFGTFRSMLIVAGVIPLGIVGALFALLVTGYTLSFTSVIGMIALIGIEIKNSILLVDFTNRLRADGVPLDDAIEQAGEIRFLPILLTSATAIGGLTPLALQGSGMYSPLAIVIIGGLISSTLLARLVTPVMYKLLPPGIEAG